VQRIWRAVRELIVEIIPAAARKAPERVKRATAIPLQTNVGARARQVSTGIANINTLFDSELIVQPRAL
jgi:hypothetical protein